MRASILVLGPLLTRFGKASVSLPGGCAIGSRPVNLHIAGLEKMGADIRVENGFINATAKRLKGTRLVMDLTTVTGTENLMMAATLAEGTTIIENAAREPEVVDLAACLNAMGAQVSGAGTDTIEICGVERLTGTHHVLPDRIKSARTSFCCHRWTRRITTNLSVGVLKRWAKRAAVSAGDDWAEADATRQRPRAVDVRTAPYPAFPTDMQAQLALNVVADGTGTISETVFENRFMHVHELRRMGADVQLAILRSRV